MSSSFIVFRISASLCAARSSTTLPVEQVEDPVGDRRGARVVGDHHDRLAVGCAHVAQQREDLGARLRVEVAGRLVGEDDGRPRDQRAGDRDALLLATGELGGPVAEAPG